MAGFFLDALTAFSGVFLCKQNPEPGWLGLRNLKTTTQKEGR
jgi:hypothetical protein